MNLPKSMDNQTTRKPDSIIKVAVVDDDASFLATMKMVFDDSKEFKCVGTYQGPIIALQEIPKVPPDVVLMDILMPEMSGIECARQLKVELPGLPIIMVTGSLDEHFVFESISADISGYLLKSTTSTKQYREAIRYAFSGEVSLSPTVARIFVRRFQLLSAQSSAQALLTTREQQIIACLLAGDSDKQIADHLGIATGTVHRHLHNVFEKLGADSRREALRKYLDFHSPPETGG